MLCSRRANRLDVLSSPRGKLAGHKLPNLPDIDRKLIVVHFLHFGTRFSTAGVLSICSAVSAMGQSAPHKDHWVEVTCHTTVVEYRLVRFRLRNYRANSQPLLARHGVQTYSSLSPSGSAKNTA